MRRSTVFISYRRNAEGGHFSLALKNRLEKDGYDCFRDQEGLRQGDWRAQLFSEIDRRDYFILLLTEGAFDGRAEGDAFVEEIERALEGGKKVIPFILKGFDESTVPEALSAISSFEHIKLSDSSEGEFELAISKLERRFARRSMGDFLHTAKGKAALIAAFAIVALIVSVLGYGVLTKQPSSSEDRPVYYEDEVEAGVLGDKVVFNSISNSPSFGDERNFVYARLADRQDLWSTSLNVADGQIYSIRLLVHNNNPNGEDALAEGVRIAFDIPDGLNTEAVITGTVFANNGEYGRYDDTVVLSSDSRFRLEYVEGSALWENNGIGRGAGVELSGGVFKENGTSVGFRALDGIIPGGTYYYGYASIEVRVVFDEHINESSVSIIGSGSWADALNEGIAGLQSEEAGFEMEVLARRAGSHEWVKTLNASVNDEVEYLIYYENTSDVVQYVTIRDVLPENAEYINGSTVLYDGSFPSGLRIDQDSLVSNGLNIGSYSPDANAYVLFKVRVADNNLESGMTGVWNWGQVGVGKTTLQDSAIFYVPKDSLNVNVRVRKGQADDWSQYLDVDSDDEVEFIVFVENTAEDTANDVHVDISLNKALEYVDGSAMLYSGSADGVLLSSFGECSVDIGSYAPQQSAYVLFKARVNTNLLENGRNKLGMSAFVSCGHFIRSWSSAVYAEG